MKRNLSSQAIRAMAIGMAVTLGSATAVSGVVTGTVVNVYAADFSTASFTATATKGGSGNKDLVITLTDVSKNFTGSGALTEFEVKSADGNKVVVDGINGVTVAPSNKTCTITIANANLKNLDGKEQGLKITKLKSTAISFDSSALDFTGNLDVTSSGAIGIDKTAPTLQGATAIYKNEASKYTVEISLKEDSLKTRSENVDQDIFTITAKRLQMVLIQ